MVAPLLLGDSSRGLLPRKYSSNRPHKVRLQVGQGLQGKLLYRRCFQSCLLPNWSSSMRWSRFLQRYVVMHVYNLAAMFVSRWSRIEDYEVIFV